jgi:Arc/MetJ-type ribon-helix-helix transcriptional regulator
MPKSKDWKDLQILTTNLSRKMITFIDECVRFGLIASRSEYIRIAVKNQLNIDFNFMNTLEHEIKEVRKKDFDPNRYVKIPGYNHNKPVKIIRRMD